LLAEKTASPGGIGVYASNSGGGRALHANGPASQGPAFGGLVKALVRVDDGGTITQCYNGTSGSSTVPCGFSVSHPVTGNYTINFGFDVYSRYVFLQHFMAGPEFATYLHSFPANAVTVGTAELAFGSYLPQSIAFELVVF